MFGALFALSLPLSLATPVMAQQGVIFGESKICQGANNDASGCQTDTGNPFTLLLLRVITLASLIAGIVCVIFVIVGGVLYVTSAGDSGKAETARNTILYALVGGLIAAVAQGIVSFVASKLNAS